MQDKIRKKCNDIRDLLLEKNKSYGNSVFDNGVLFSVDPMYAIQARINDKLNRIKSRETYMSENDLMDLTGYLILLQVHMDEVDKRLSKSINSAEKLDRDTVIDGIGDYITCSGNNEYEWDLNNKNNEEGTPI